MDQSHRGRPIAENPVAGAAEQTASPDSEPATAIASPAQLQAWAAADASRASGGDGSADSEPATAVASPAVLEALAAEDARAVAQPPGATAAAALANVPTAAPAGFDGASTMAFPEGYEALDLAAGGAGPPPERLLPAPGPPPSPGSIGLGYPAPPAAPAPSAWVAPAQRDGSPETVVGPRPPARPPGAGTGLWVVGFIVLFVVTLAAAFLAARWLLVGS